MAHQGNNIQERNANNPNNQERFNELKKLIGEQESRIQNLQNSAFQLANYYFVFQGVVLAATSNSTSLTCSDAWYTFTLSLIAAILNLFALFSIVSKYIRAMDLHDQTWSEYNSVARMLSTRNQNRASQIPLEFLGSFSPAPENNNNNNSSNNDRLNEQRINVANTERQWRDGVSQGQRYVVLVVCMVLFLGFTGVTLSGPWRVTCKHDHYRKHQDCFKLCNGARCMIFCQDT